MTCRAPDCRRKPQVHSCWCPAHYAMLVDRALLGKRCGEGWHAQRPLRVMA